MSTPLVATNSRVKEARKLSRRSVRTERRLFLADGPKAVEGALSVAGCVVEVFATPAARDQHAGLLAGTATTLVDERAMASLSDSVTPAGVVAVCRPLDAPLEHVLRASPRLLAICADVRDPGNAGTVIRTADAAGADAVVLAGHSVDPYNGKCLRASAGSIFSIPVVSDDDAAQAVTAMNAAGLQVLATTVDGEVSLDDADLSGPTAWLFGPEAHGLPSELAAKATHRVHIPMPGSAESLNVAAAAAICLYQSARAHR